MRENQNRKRYGALRILTALVLAGILAYGGIVAMTCVEEGKVPKTLAVHVDYDAIIVLGAQVKPDRTLSVQLTWRMDAAAEAYKKKNVPIVVCGARGPDEPCTEAEAMKEYLLEKGIPEDIILTDPRSFNTNENLENAQELLKGFQNINRVLIVTSDYHVPRSLPLRRILDLRQKDTVRNAFRNAGSRIIPGKPWHGANTGRRNTSACPCEDTA